MFQNCSPSITVSGGSPAKRHIISPLEIRLSSYITAMFDGDTRSVLSHNNFNFVDKERYQPMFDSSEKNRSNQTQQYFRKVFTRKYSSIRTLAKDNISPNSRISFLSNCFKDL